MQMNKSVLRILQIIGAIIVCLAAQGCVFKKAKQVSESCVNTFHQELNDAKFTEMYAATTDGFKSTGSESEFIKFMSAVHQKLGAYESSKQISWRVNAGFKKTVAVVKYESTFEKGKAVETFAVIVSGESAAIQGYLIESRALLTN